MFVSHDLSSISKYCDRVYLLNQGNLLGEGKPKEMIDAFKQVLVGQYEIKDNGEENTLPESVLNPELLEYGTKQAEITEFYITDDKNVKTTAVIKGSSFTIHVKVQFHERIVAPIFAFSFKNVKGTEITGTNTMIEKAFLEPVEAGNVKNVTFTQKMSLQGGEYLLSLGVTGYAGNDFQVYHRLYDVLNITVVSDKDTVGFYDMDSKVEVKGESVPAGRVIPYRQEA